VEEGVGDAVAVAVTVPDLLCVGLTLGEKEGELLGEGEALGGAHAAPGPADITRTRPYRESAIKRRPSGATASACGALRSAAAASPPSPLLPG
jgi:hypothetical protein